MQGTGEDFSRSLPVLHVHDSVNAGIHLALPVSLHHFLRSLAWNLAIHLGCLKTYSGLCSPIPQMPLEKQYPNCMGTGWPSESVTSFRAFHLQAADSNLAHVSDNSALPLPMTICGQMEISLVVLQCLEDKCLRHSATFVRAWRIQRESWHGCCPWFYSVHKWRDSFSRTVNLTPLTSTTFTYKLKKQKYPSPIFYLSS